MTVDRMVELLEIEHECMLRKSHNGCDGKCEDCELVQDDGDLHEMYMNVIGLLKSQRPRLVTHDEVSGNDIDDTYVWIEIIDTHIGYDSRKYMEHELASAKKYSDRYFHILGSFADEDGCFDFDRGTELETMGDTWYRCRFGAGDTIQWRFWTDKPTAKQMEETKWE